MADFNGKLEFSKSVEITRLLSELGEEFDTSPMELREVLDLLNRHRKEISSSHVTLHELLHNSSPRMKRTTQKNPKFEKYLEMARGRACKRDYDSLMGRENSLVGLGINGKEIRDSLTVGGNLIAGAATGFVFFYVLGSSRYNGDFKLSVICGAVGLVGALIIESILFVIRANRMDEAELLQKKLD